MWGPAIGCLYVVRIIKSTKKKKGEEKKKKRRKLFFSLLKGKTGIWLNWAAYIQVRICQWVLLLVATTVRGISRNSSSSVFYCSAAAVGKRKGCSTSTASDTCSAEAVAVGKCKFLKPICYTKNLLFWTGKIAHTQIGIWRRGGRELMDMEKAQICLE